MELHDLHLTHSEALKEVSSYTGQKLAKTD